MDPRVGTLANIGLLCILGEAAFAEGEHDRESTVHNCEAVDDHQFGASGEVSIQLHFFGRF